MSRLFGVQETRATLALEDGSCYEGIACGAAGMAGGEVVFNTSMTGYQEVLTDPSYTGQIVTMTCPQIGNYGVSPADCESEGGPKVAGFVVRELSPLASNWGAAGPLGEYLVQHGIVAIAGIDTRALTRKLRSAGVMRGVIATGVHDRATLVSRARALPSMEGADLVAGVSCAASQPPDGTRPGGPLVAAYDFGMKANILRRLHAHGCQVHVFPAATPAAEILARQPAGLFLSNGPGDPAALGWVVSNIRTILDAGVPTFGICLGHQLLALALGARTFKLKFGHRGANHPVKHLETGRVEITSQNHGFAVDPATLPDGLEVTHQSLYDGTIEGFRHRERPVFCVQYHPEASPGPHDADYLFERFAALLSAVTP